MMSWQWNSTSFQAIIYLYYHAWHLLKTFVRSTYTCFSSQWNIVTIHAINLLMLLHETLWLFMPFGNVAIRLFKLWRSCNLACYLISVSDPCALSTIAWSHWILVKFVWHHYWPLDSNPEPMWLFSLRFQSPAMFLPIYLNDPLWFLGGTSHWASRMVVIEKSHNLAFLCNGKFNGD